MEGVKRSNCQSDVSTPVCAANGSIAIVTIVTSE